MLLGSAERPVTLTFLLVPLLVDLMLMITLLIKEITMNKQSLLLTTMLPLLVYWQGYIAAQVDIASFFQVFSFSFSVYFKFLGVI